MSYIGAEPITVVAGGTGRTTLTNHGILVGAAGAAITQLGVGNTNTVLLGNTGVDPSFGTVPNAALTNSSVTLSNGNNITVTGSPLSLGGTASFNLTGTTNHALQIGNATASLTSLAVGATNTVLLGNTGADPSFGTVPNGALTNSSVTISSGNNITVTGGGPLALGGTASLNLTGTTNHAVQIGNSTNSLTSLAVGTNGQLLCGSTAADPAFTTLTSTGSTLTYTTGAHTLNIDVTAPLTVPNGGTGRTTLTNHGVLIGAATAAITQLAAAAANTLLQGQGAADPSFTGSPSVSGTMTAATGITATAGAITATAGNVVITAGNLTLPNTTATPTGEVQIGGNRFLHNFGTNNTFVGSTAGNTTLTTGSATQCTCVGTAAGIAITTAVNTTGFGYNALTAVTSGASNVGVGSRALAACTTGASNVGIGTIAIPANITGAQNNGIGQGALQLMTGGNSNQSIGFASLNQLLTGSFNIGLGDTVGVNYNNAESSNIVISNAGVTGESNVIRIGTTGTGNSQQSKCFVAGIFGVTVGVSGIPVVVDNAGQLGTVVSSARFKENIKEINEESSSIYDLRPVSFNYRNDSSKSEHYGLIAEEVDAVLPKLVVYDSDGFPFTVRYSDLPVLLLNEIRKLKEEIELLKKHIN